MKEKKQSSLTVLLGYAGSCKGLTFLGLGLSALAMILSMAPYICIWLAARDLILAAPDWTEAAGIIRYGWWAFGFAVAGIGVYFAALMCTHLAAFRTASNCDEFVRKLPQGYEPQTDRQRRRDRLCRFLIFQTCRKGKDGSQLKCRGFQRPLNPDLQIRSSPFYKCSPPVI